MRPRRVGGALALCLFAGCASGPFARTATPRGDEVTALKARLVELQRQVTVHEVELTRLRERLVALEAGRGPTNAAPRVATPAAPPPPRAQGLDDGVRPQAGDSLEQADLPAAPPTAHPPPAPPAANPGSLGAGGITPPAGEVIAAPAEALARYDRALELYQTGKYAEAEGAFRTFLDAWPSTDLTDNAGYWIGESRWSRQDYEGALAAFRQAIERQPTGNKVPDSLFKMGRCLEQLQDDEGAREVYGEVVRRFAGTAVAVTAGERLANLP